jgi:hypothetical protein
MAGREDRPIEQNRVEYLKIVLGNQSWSANEEILPKSEEDGFAYSGFPGIE